MAYNEIQFKGFKLINALGADIAAVLKDYANVNGILYLVRTNPDDADYKDGYLVLNGKVYGSGEETKKTLVAKFGVELNGIKGAITAITESGGTIDTKINTAIEGLDATAKTSGTTYISGEIVETDGKLTSFNINENNLTGKFTQIDNTITAITGDTGTISDKIENAIEGLNASVTGTSTGNYITVKVDQANGKLTGVTVTETLGTASKANVNKDGLSIPENNEDNSGKTGLTTAAQVENFVKASVANLTGAMHFKGIVPIEGNLPAATDYKAGDVILKGTKEYVLNETGGVKSWVELGDEGLYVTKSTTIAGIDLVDNITKEELLSNLNVADGAQVNKLEGVNVNGTKLNITNKEVDITVETGETNGTIKVNSAEVAVAGLKSAAYVETTAFDAAGTATDAIAAISGTTSGTSTNSYVTVATTQEDGKVTKIDVNDATLKTTIDNLSNAAVKNVNGKKGNNITLTGADIAVGADVDGTGGTMTSDSTVSTVLADIYTKLNTANTNAYTGITADENDTVIVTETTHGHSVAVNLKTLSDTEKASGLIQLVSAEDGSGIYGKLFFDGTEIEAKPK